MRFQKSVHLAFTKFTNILLLEFVLKNEILDLDDNPM